MNHINPFWSLNFQLGVLNGSQTYRLNGSQTYRLNGLIHSFRLDWTNQILAHLNASLNRLGLFKSNLIRIKWVSSWAGPFFFINCNTLKNF